MLTRQQQLDLVTLAGRAPSPHNIQPARWRFVGDVLELWEAPSRWLVVGDPQGRDNLISLGMAWEGMTIALAQLGLSLELQARDALMYPAGKPGPRRVASGRFSSGGCADSLFASLENRRSWRGDFKPSSREQLQALDACIAAHPAVAMTVPDAVAAQVCKWYDEAAAVGLNDAAFARELYGWMRFSPRDRNWLRDGLSADCLALSGFEAWGASFALKPAVVRVLAAFSLTQLLVSEASKIRSAARVVMIHVPVHAEPFDSGRAWLRFWLALAAAGFAGVPMSALSDAPAYAVRLVAAVPLPPDRRLINVMRLGPAPASVPRSARLPAAELLLE